MRFLRWATVPLMVLLLAACGGGPATSSTGTTSSTSTTAPAQQGHQTPYGLSAHSPTFGLPPKNLPLPAPVLGQVPTLTMLDSVSSLSVFSGLNPLAVAGYTSGSWPTFFQYQGHFKYVVAVMVNTSHFGEHGAARSCLDVEPGDATPDEAGPWDKTELANGFVPCNYGSLSEMPAIKASIGRAGIPLSKVMLWDANWTYVAHLDSGYQATQWTDHYSGRNIDGTTASYAFVGYRAKPPAPRLVCWGKGSTPHSPACRKIEATATRYWRAYVAFHKGFLRWQAQVRPVQGRVSALSQKKVSVTVPGYKGPGLGYAVAAEKAAGYYEKVNYTRHREVVVRYKRG